MKAEVLARVEWAAALALAAPPIGGAEAGGQAATAKIAGAAVTKKIVGVGLAAFVAGAGVGGGAALRLAGRVDPSSTSTRARPPADSSENATPRRETVPLESPPAPAEVPAVPSGMAPGNTPHPRGSVQVDRPTGRADLVRERELLDAARAALARGRAQDAMDYAERHARLWPRGALTEERELLAIQALVVLDATGRRARDRAERFRREYPNSILTSAVDAALESAPDEKKTPKP
jgi:hypothetical protein